MYLAFLGLLWSLGACGEIQVAILMQGSDFINISVVPLFSVNQFDLGDVFISPCRTGTYNDIRDSFCKPCAVCVEGQFERASCISVRNSECVNCTVCTPREQQICACNERTSDCVTGDRICAPLPMTTANISFDLSVSQPLSSLKERFLQEGLRTGFVLFLAGYLQHSDESIVFLFMRKIGPTQYFTTFLVNDVYSLFTKRQVELISRAVVQDGLTNTFGIQSNTFSTVSQQRRMLRRLLQQDAIVLLADKVEAQCVAAGACSRFFVMSNPDNPCESTCISLPCPPGYTGFYGICELCANATYKSTHGNESCTPCPTGWASDQGATSLDECRAPAPSTPPPTTSVSSVLTRTVTSTSAQTALSPLPPQSASTGATSTTVRASQRALTSSTVYAMPITGRNTGTMAATPVPTTPAVQSTEAGRVTAPPAPGPGGGVVNNYQIFNVSFVQNLFFSEWNTGRAGTVEYITINEQRDDWAMTMAGGLMFAGFFALGAIGARLFWVIQRPSARTTPAIVVKEEDGRTVIPIPVKRDPAPTKREPSPVRHSSPPILPVHLGGQGPAVYRRWASGSPLS